MEAPGSSSLVADAGWTPPEGGAKKEFMIDGTYAATMHLVTAGGMHAVGVA